VCERHRIEYDVKMFLCNLFNSYRISRARLRLTLTAFPVFYRTRTKVVTVAKFLFAHARMWPFPVAPCLQ
jgi:hypothetical protein